MFALDYALCSDRGLVRDNNEDSAYAGPHLLVLADGMGGHAAGEVASQLMVRHMIVLDADAGDNDVLALMAAQADEGNKAIKAHVHAHPETDGMGCTLTAVMVGEEGVGLCHVGDSRGYVLRDGTLAQITHDDTYVQSLVEAGQLDPEKVSTHPERSKLMKAYVGIPVEPLLTDLDMEVGDRLLICSDGLTDPVSFSTIEKTLSEGTPQEAGERLISLALRSGGPDNVTVIVADLIDAGDERAAALPQTPVSGGALSEEPEPDSHPDTAAGRAAALRRKPQVIPADPEKLEAGDAVVRKASSRWSAAVTWLVVLIVLAVLAVGAIVGYRMINNHYFVGTAASTTPSPKPAAGSDERIVIYRGVSLGSMNSLYQLACIDAGGNVSFEDADESNGTPCNPFHVAALKEEARARVSGLPGGSYTDVLAQVQRLAEEALPVCVTREKPTDSPTQATEAPSPSSGDLTQPGINCRLVAASGEGQ
ncbi:MAG: protein phosphatase 2C domain-containing protein [Corynebacterium sp.]|nr:protein phosphatase 2C domain-containing protein [Corynebacterium sp.]